MEYQILGKSDLNIGRIGFGCMSLDPSDPESEKILHRALDEGINYFDTADLYNKGQNESLLGRSFNRRRNQVMIATKAGNQWRPDGSGWDWNPSIKYLLECLEQSLRRLNTDYIDLFQLHGGTMDDPIDDIIDTFEKLKSSGKIRYYGISSIRPKVIHEWVKKSGMVSVMMQYSLLDRRPEEEALPLLSENEIGVLARGTLARGLLVSKKPEPFLNYTSDEVANAARCIREIADDRRSATSVAIQYALGAPAIQSAIVGIRTMKQLEDAIEAVKSPPLTNSEREMLNGLLLPNHYQ